MATKREELQSGCMFRADDDEPVFVLRATDKLAPDLIRQWAILAHAKGCPEVKCDEAVKCAEAMEAWPNRKYPD